MNGFALMALLTGLMTVISFTSGVRVMARSGHRCSAVWMAWRAVFQGAAVATVFAALLARAL